MRIGETDLPSDDFFDNLPNWAILEQMLKGTYENILVSDCGDDDDDDDGDGDGDTYGWMNGWMDGWMDDDDGLKVFIIVIVLFKPIFKLLPSFIISFVNYDLTSVSLILLI